MNTAARLQQACRDTGQRVLASAALVNRLAALPPGIVKRSIGRLRLRGKENEIELYALTAAVSATRAFSGLTESAVFSLCWICDSTFVSNRHGGCDGQAIFSGLA
jgi:hypothetical protein